MPDSTPAPLCTWPDCLTPEQQTELADQVTASMLGEKTTPGPDQRPICGCREEAGDATETAISTPVASWPGYRCGNPDPHPAHRGMAGPSLCRGTPAPDGDGQATAVCHCGLGTRQQCATEPWGCAHDREHATEAPRSGEVAAVRAELDRIAELPTVTCDDGRADRFSTGARWTLRMIREVLNGQEHTP